MFRFNHHHQGAYYLSFATVLNVILNSATHTHTHTHTHQYGPNKMCSHTTETTRTLY
jgi:hypothetical protein